MTTIRDYAKKHHVSYEAIRSQVSRYRDQLGEHIVTKGQTKYLDDFAVEFLDNRRKDNPLVVVNSDQREEVERLTQQIDALKNELMTTQKRVIELQSENQLMLADKARYDLLLESSNEKQAMIETLRDDLKSARADAERTRDDLDAAKADAEKIRKEADETREKLEKERDAAQADARSYRKSVFGFYRKVKG